MTSQLGLDETDVATLIAILQKHDEVEEACIFGSRAKGNFKHGSDVDVALKGSLVTQDVVTSISYELNEETLMPYRFDVLNFSTISSKELMEHIARVGVTIYKRRSRMSELSEK